MPNRLVIIAVFLFCIFNLPASFAGGEISKEDMEIIKNLELLEEMELVQNQDYPLMENYEEINKVDSDKGDTDEDETP